MPKKAMILKPMPDMVRFPVPLAEMSLARFAAHGCDPDHTPADLPTDVAALGGELHREARPASIFVAPALASDGGFGYGGRPLH
jgi:hypothetical protein